MTYSISFMLILLGSASMLSLYNFGTLSGLLMLYVPLHMYRQLHGAYQTSRAGAICRTVALLLFSTFALTLLVVAILGVVAAG